MRTTEVFIEQVLIGCLVGAVIVLLVFPHPWTTLEAMWQTDSAGRAAALSAGFLGLAYLVGILFDRIADTLLEELDKHHRLHIMFRFKRNTFPEHEMRLALLRESSGVLDHAGYLRTRLRLVRAMAALSPAVTLAWIAHCIGQADARWVQVVGVLVITYGLAYTAKLAGFDRRPPRPENEKKIKKYRELFYDGNDLRTTRMLISDAAVRAAVLSFAWAFQFSDFLYWREVVTGAAVTMVAASAWWRISTTYRNLLLGVWSTSPRPPWTFEP